MPIAVIVPVRTGSLDTPVGLAAIATCPRVGYLRPGGIFSKVERSRVKIFGESDREGGIDLMPVPGLEADRHISLSVRPPTPDHMTRSDDKPRAHRNTGSFVLAANQNPAAVLPARRVRSLRALPHPHGHSFA